MSISIYMLRLEQSCYYVGKTQRNILTRYAEHVKGKGAIWTRVHKPLTIHNVIYTNSPFDEDKYVKEYMYKYGIDNVRGGSYSTLLLNDTQIHFIQKEIWGATDKCLNCGSSDHFVTKCPERIIDITKRR